MDSQTLREEFAIALRKDGVLRDAAMALIRERDELTERIEAANLLITAAKAEASLARGELAAAQRKLHDIAKRRADCGIEAIGVHGLSEATEVER